MLLVCNTFAVMQRVVARVCQRQLIIVLTQWLRLLYHPVYIVLVALTTTTINVSCTYCDIMYVCCCSYTGNDESIILCGDSQGCVNVLMIKSAGERLRYCVNGIAKVVRSNFVQ